MIARKGIDVITVIWDVVPILVIRHVLTPLHPRTMVQFEEDDLNDQSSIESVVFAKNIWSTSAADIVCYQRLERLLELEKSAVTCRLMRRCHHSTISILQRG